MTKPCVHPSVTTVFFVTFTVRSGSNLLCDYLSQLQLGQATEFFQPPFGQTNAWFYEQVGAARDDFATFLPALTERFSASGIFGSKLDWAHRNALEAAVVEHFGCRSLQEAFNPVWIRIIREDKIAQAISTWRAMHSKVWLRRTTDPIAAQPAPQYDYEALRQCLLNLTGVEYVWTHYFRRQGITPIAVTYEELIAQPNAALARIVAPLRARAGLPPLSAIAVPESTLAVQRDAFSEKVYTRFVADLDRAGVPGHKPGAPLE